MSNNKKKVPHNFTGKVLNWKYCKQCGLITLKNEATRRAMKQPCDTD